jgi:hypothetical protein
MEVEAIIDASALVRRDEADAQNCAIATEKGTNHRLRQTTNIQRHLCGQ